jgi:hypothetical protein
MSWFNSLFGRGGVRPVQVRDVTNTRALPPAAGAVTRAGSLSTRGGALAPRGGNLGAGLASLVYSIPGYQEQKQRNAADVLNIARGPINELQYAAGQLMQGQIPYTSPRVGNLPPNYRGDELRLSAAARAATGPTAGGGIGGGNMASYIPAETSFAGTEGRNPAERAYQQEKSRVAQLTAQDPELQRYEAARRLAAAPGATPEQVQSAEDIGMAMWAKANPKLAAKVQPGQSGFDVIQKQTGQMPAPSFNPLMQRTFGYQTGGGSTTMGEPTLGPTPLTPQVDQALNPASPTFVGGEGAPFLNFSDENLTPEMIEAYQRQLLGQAKNK